MTESIRLNQVNIVVRDMEAAVSFYRLLGVEVADTLTEWMPHHRDVESVADGFEASLDSTSFAPHWDQGFPRGGSGVVLSFRVGRREVVDELYARAIAAGYTGQQEPYDAFWGERYAVLEDPDGNPIGLMSDSNRSVRSAPPDPSSFT